MRIASQLLTIVHLTFLILLIGMSRKLWLDNVLLLKGISVRISRGFKSRLRLSNRGCVHAVAEWMSRQEHGRDVWHVTLTHKDEQRIITTKTLPFYYGKNRKTGKLKLDKDDLIRNINAAVIDWGRGSRWKFTCLDDDAPDKKTSKEQPMNKYEII